RIAYESWPSLTQRPARPRRLHAMVFHGDIGSQSSCGLEQALSDELAFRRPARASEQPAADMGHELIHHVELRHPVVDLDEASPRVALVGHEEQARVILHALPPWRPALGGEIDAVIVGVR